MELRKVPIGKIVPYESNPRINDEAVDAVAESIRQCGYCAPIVVDENMVILAGHTRHKALQKLGGWNECPVCVVEGLSQEQKRKYRLLDNKTNELAKWDFALLDQELAEMDFDGFDFGFAVNLDSWFDRKEKDGKDTTGESDDYREFVEKFEPKKTTDDCYTPDNVYGAVAEWVRKEYETKTPVFVRPFYPGGDYKKEKYEKGCVVVDNPPFSILAEIIRFYQQEGIKFFLFAPTLTLFSARDVQGITYIPVGVGVTYENGACVNTSFITNMDKPKVRTAPDLYQIVKKENEKNLKEMKKELPVYSYPDYVVTAAMAARWSKYGIDFEIFENEAFRISELDAQKEKGKAIFGGGFLISENASKRKAAAEKAAAEKAAAEKWELSEREVAIINSLGC